MASKAAQNELYRPLSRWRLVAVRAAETNKPISKANRLQALLDQLDTHVW